MVKTPKTESGSPEAVVLERQYGPYHAKICFAAVEYPNAPQNVLDAIMQAYRCRMEKNISLE